MSQSTRKQIILVKKQDTDTGLATDDAAPVANLNALLVIEPVVTMEAELIEREFVQASFSHLGHVVGIRSGRITFGTEFRGIGAIPTSAAPLRENPLYMAAGYSPQYAAGSSAVYRPKTDWGAVVNACTIYAYLDGLLHVFYGMRGNMTAEARVGQFIRQNWEMQGAFAVINYPTPGASDGVRDSAFATQAALVEYQSINADPPLFMGADIGLGTSSAVYSPAYAPCIETWRYDSGNEVTQRRCATAANGVAGYVITGRRPNGSMDPESVLRADFDYWGRWAAGKKGTLRVRVGTAGPSATNSGRVTFQAPAIQIGNMNYGDRNNIRTLEMPYTCNQASSVGDDEAEFVYD